jgi:hypothetical protein
MVVGIGLLFWGISTKPNEVLADATQISASVTDELMYLPLIQKPSVAKVVVTDKGTSIGYPTLYWAFGYVENLSAANNLSITVGIDVTYHPYCEPPPPCDSYTVTEPVYLAFDTTTPGQINPFKYSLILGKAWAELGEVQIHSILPAAQDVYPVKILNWTRDEGLISGIAQNDTNHTLDPVRVIVGADQCGWREATLDTAALQPEQETSFNIDYPYCEIDELYVIGQGSLYQ